LKRRPATVDLKRVTTRPLAGRPSLASVKALAGVMPARGADVFFENLPAFLKANDLKALIKAIISARRRNKPVIVMAGGHVIKVGLSPILIDLLERGWISGLCLNGAGVIHDCEIAFAGRTSEDVAEGIRDGSFGMAAETAERYAEIVRAAGENGIGLGQAAGLIIEKSGARFKRHSLLAAAYRLSLPATVHIAVDTDIVCQHPQYDAAGAARASHHDFTILAREISRGENGGVFINIGSAVILPEVFLKALSVARNIYGRPRKIVTANFDMIFQYRPLVNVVRRPTAHGGAGYNFVGHHELMIPLLAWGLKSYGRKGRRGKNAPDTRE